MGSFENNKINGLTSYGENVLNSIVALAAKEIVGVASLQGRGVRVVVAKKVLAVDVFLNVLSTVRCSDVAFRVQENIKRIVEGMTDYKVNTVNVSILGVVDENYLLLGSNESDNIGDKDE